MTSPYLKADALLVLLGGHNFEYGSNAPPHFGFRETTMSHGSYGFMVPRSNVMALIGLFQSELLLPQDQWLKPDVAWYEFARCSNKRVYAVAPLLVQHDAGWSNTWSGFRKTISSGGPPSIVIGVGTDWGRCGTMALASLLNQQPHSTVTHKLRSNDGQRDDVRVPLPYWPTRINGNAADPGDHEALKRLQWLESLRDADADADADADYSGAAAVGKQRRFQLDSHWYAANITEYNPATKQHKIVYIDDGVVQWLKMDEHPHKAMPHIPKAHTVGDVWSAHMPFVEGYIRLRPDVKIVIMRHNCKTFNVPEHDWLPPPYFTHMPLREALARYCEQMLNMTENYRTRYSRNVRVYNAAALLSSNSTSSKLRGQMLAWVGYDRDTLSNRLPNQQCQ